MNPFRLTGAAGILAVGMTLTGWLLQPIRAEEPRLPAEFTRLQGLIKPGANESQVEQVPWMPTIWEARIKAAAEGKPIFLWVAGGPPGGC